MGHGVVRPGHEIVRRIFAEYNAGSSMREIANRLQDEQVPTARMNGKWNTSKGSWSTQRIKERLEAVIYQGDLGSRLHDDVRHCFTRARASP